MKPRQKPILKNQSFVYRHPKLTVYSLTTAALLVFFSKPIYDIFIRDSREYALEFEEMRRTSRSRFEKD